MRRSFLQTATVLGLPSAIGPFAIDKYLPALPSIGKSLGASVSDVQASLTAFFMALALGQIIYGPVSDMHGRAQSAAVLRYCAVRSGQRARVRVTRAGKDLFGTANLDPNGQSQAAQL